MTGSGRSVARLGSLSDIAIDVVWLGLAITPPFALYAGAYKSLSATFTDETDDAFMIICFIAMIMTATVYLPDILTRWGKRKGRPVP